MVMGIFPALLFQSSDREREKRAFSIAVVENPLIVVLILQTNPDVMHKPHH